MEAKYFYNRLLKYEKDSKESGKYCYDYSNGIIRIHRRKDRDTKYFTIYKDGTVYVRDENMSFGDKIRIEDLKGSDYELYNPIQIFKCGYVFFPNSESSFDIKKYIRDLFNKIGCIEDDNLESIENDKDLNKKQPMLIGSSIWLHGYTTDFSYNSTSDIELTIRTIGELYKENINRKYYDKKCIPFIKDIHKNKAFHVTFKEYHNRENIQERCESALEELLSLIDEPHTWYECTMKKTIHV